MNHDSANYLLVPDILLLLSFRHCNSHDYSKTISVTVKKKTRESLVNLQVSRFNSIQQFRVFRTTRNLKSPKWLPNRSLCEQTVKDTVKASIRLVILFGILVKKTEFGMHFVQSQHSLVKFKFKRVWSACEMCCM